MVSQARVDRQLSLDSKPIDTAGGEPGRGWSETQNSLSALKSDWVRVRSLSRCLDRQLEHQSNYHLFYQTLKEYQTGLEASFAAFRAQLSSRSFSGTKDEAKWLFEQMQAMITLVLQWWQRIDSLIIQSRKVLPMASRLGPLDMKRPGKILADFDVQGVSLKANDDVFVVDTSDRDTWTVETTRGRELRLPAICVSISGPDPEVMERSLGVRTGLLADWSGALKEVGRSLVSFTLGVFRRMRTAETESLSEPNLDGSDLQPLLGLMERLLQAYPNRHPEAEDMAERIGKARVSLAIYEDPQDIDDYTHIDINTLFLQLSPLTVVSEETEDSGGVTQKMLNLLLRKYQELMKYWEVYRVLVETSNDPNYFWMMEEFQKLRYINVTELLNFLASEDKETWLHYIHRMMSRSGRGPPDPVVTSARLDRDLELRPENELRLADPPKPPEASRVLIDAQNGTAFVQSDRQPRVGDPVTAEIIVDGARQFEDDVDGGRDSPVPAPAADEQQKQDQETFTTTASLIVNAGPDAAEEAEAEDKAEPPVQQQPERPPTPANSESSVASSGVRDRVAALERSLSSRESLAKPSPLASPSKSVPAATAEVEELKRDEVEQNSRIVISGVVDTLDNSTLSMQEAIDKGIIHSESGSYLNRATNSWIPIPVALSEGLILAERRTEEPREVKKQQVYGIVTIKGGSGGGGGRPSFVVTAIHDRLRRSKLSPEEAQTAGLTDASLTRFLDTERNEWLSADEAAERGLVEHDVGPAAGSGGSGDSDVGSDVSYVVYSVVDVANKANVSFKEARELGLIDAEEGTFVNSRTDERLEFDEAIRRGFLKADRVTGPVSQVAGAEDRLVVNRLRSAKNRLRGAVKAMRGFGARGSN